ncbi:hypothetical protein OKJ48_23830 [Streptomyces kunmingensis]|uniref:Uncharacterized protein n=1 Tax=Streptomyces kunmingensis TaxID=68225 RepID=A0ABU6CEV9_9ACTN|nr:hypothetical protein [Streptomyces kunmingensis]MEB3963250.1 hypothetical protein [Streptomyces kunmingensis]
MERPLLTTRATLVLLLAILSGAAAAALSWWAGEGLARSVLAGLATTGLAVSFFNRLIAGENVRGGARGGGEEEEHG